MSDRISETLTWEDWRARHLACLVDLCRYNPNRLLTLPPKLAEEIINELAKEPDRA